MDQILLLERAIAVSTSGTGNLENLKPSKNLKGPVGVGLILLLGHEMEN